MNETLLALHAALSSILMAKELAADTSALRAHLGNNILERTMVANIAAVKQLTVELEAELQENGPE